MRALLAPLIGLSGLVAVVAGDEPAPRSHAVSSPDERIRMEVSLGEDSQPRYQVSYQGQPVVLPSRLGIDLAGGSTLGGGSIIEGVQRRSFRETYDQFPGKRSRVLDEGEEAVIRFRERAAPARRWELVVRAYDHGIAFRYRFPAQEGWPRLEIAGERTGFRLPGDPTTFAMPVPSFATPHEEHYRKRTVSQFPKDGLVGLPLLAELPGTGWAAILEADLTDYAALYLARTGESGAALAARLAPRPGQPELAVRAELPHESPWRVVMIADRPERLVESDLVLNLNKPNAIGDTSWIHPGKTTFPWWNGFHEEKGKVAFPMGLNTETAKYYIDFCAEAGIPYHSLDGLDNIAWYGGTIVPYTGGDITQGIAGLDLPEVIRYAKSKGVKLRLWMHWQAAEKHMDRAFPLYQEWGIEGVMIDFLNRDDQEMSHFIHRLLRTAAAHRLTVTVHNTKETTGLERTYPNLLTTEGVRNWEYNKNDGDPVGIPPEEDLMVPFTRMLAGPLDYHQGTLRGVPVEHYRSRNVAPLVMGTPCHMLASYVVYQNHLPMVADYPSAYRGHPALPVLVQIPETWDDTRGLAGSVGEYAVVARRKGDDWWVGAMAGRQARAVEIPLDFLGKGLYQATVYRDDLKSASRLATATSEVGPERVLRALLAPAGGALIRLTPAPR